MSGRLLLPTECVDRLPPLRSTDGQLGAAVAHVKLFAPDSSWTWYLTEYDPAECLAFGLVVGHEVELGYIAIDELEGVRGPLGLPIERDLYWRPRPLAELPECPDWLRRADDGEETGS